MKEQTRPYLISMELESRNNKLDTIGVTNEKNESSTPSKFNVLDHYEQLIKQTPMMVIIFATMALSCLLIFHSSITLPFSGGYTTTNLVATTNHRPNSLDINVGQLRRILKDATMGNKTVIITSLNDAWAEPQSMFDLLLESFRIGNQTKRFLKHLVVVTVDRKAYARCLKLHPHCYHLNGSDFSREADFMTADYLKIVWRKIKFLGKVLDLGYSFVFTDADIMWFRDPFSQLDKDTDIQISCDVFNGNPFDLRNLPNTGFSYVKSTNKTIQLYKFWYKSRMTYPNLHDQDVFNKIRFHPFIRDLGIAIRFMDTDYFGGFCQPSRDLNKVCTMHANCCVGLENKVHDIEIMLDDWRKYLKSHVNKDEYNAWWTVPQHCRGSLDRPRPPKKKADEAMKS
ncbi:hypothetical protein QVD17_26957 [Tagetes erecta]|uniref:Nucleotide-diphospho-sugar transferase domain-containing protein n=1 Tax=Tagetes erecta TaxID=13708 RepID=A0AAD8K885_TARER|nr:hypothetical protein QVD17_26957 [Tagetes erecta]